jgi:hypothetical protein
MITLPLRNQVRRTAFGLSSTRRISRSINSDVTSKKGSATRLIPPRPVSTRCRAPQAGCRRGAALSFLDCRTSGASHGSRRSTSRRQHDFRVLRRAGALPLRSLSGAKRALLHDSAFLNSPADKPTARSSFSDARPIDSTFGAVPTSVLIIATAFVASSSATT